MSLVDRKAQAEYSYYVHRARRETTYLADMVEMYPDDLERARMGAAEMFYFSEHDELPDWGYVIDHVEYVNGQCIFVHSDRRLPA